MRFALTTLFLVLALVAPADAVAMPGCAPGHAMAQAATRPAEPCPHCASSAPVDDAQRDSQREGKAGCGAASCCADPAAPPATPADGQLPLSGGVLAPAPGASIAARKPPPRRPERARAPVCARSGTARSLNVLHCVWRL